MGPLLGSSPTSRKGGLFESAATAFIARITRRDWDKRIGEETDPYMLRWHVIPRNRFFNIYLHNVLRSDDPRAPHDHPWWNVSIVLTGYYIELMWTKRGIVQKLRNRGSFVFRLPTALHRLVITPDSVEGATWTLFITGPVVRVWGFSCRSGWKPWFEYANLEGKNATVGAGCGEDA